MTHSSTLAFMDYWRSLRVGNDLAPLRQRFDPVRLKPLMPQMLMLSAEPRHRFRLSGGLIGAMHGGDLKDRVFLDLYRTACHDSVAASLALACRRGQPVLLTQSAPWRARFAPTSDETGLFRDEVIDFEICLCPLSTPEGRIDRLVGLFQPLSRLPQPLQGRLAAWRLDSARLHDGHGAQRVPHLQLITLEGKRIA